MTKNKPPKNMPIILAGGKSGGPIVPLLAVVKTWQQTEPGLTAIIVDLKNSPGQHLAEQEKLDFYAIITGKFRRYWWAWQNLFLPLALLIGFIQSLILLKRIKPKLVFGAGGFVQVPLMFAAWLLRIPRVIHQQDVLVSLSNQICSPIANLITTTFRDSTKKFLQGSGIGEEYLKHNKVHWTGNPVRSDMSKLPTKKAARQKFNLSDKLPTLLVLGGGAGSKAINDLVLNNLTELTKVVQIIHSLGVDRDSSSNPHNPNYHPFRFIDDMAGAYAAADLVLTRAGIGTLTELATVLVPGIIIPIPDTHQELNAELLFQHKAALVLDQGDLDSKQLIMTIRKILFDAELSKTLVKNMAALFTNNANQNIINLLKKLI